MKPTLITAERLTQIIIDHVKGGRVHAVYSLIATRDHIWADALAALEQRGEPDQDKRVRQHAATVTSSKSDAPAGKQT